jgi:hypothetical protein
MARQAINEEYFSGSQASIFIGDVWVDEIIDWQISYGASATPIYGYGDTFFSHAAQGRVLVQGSFTINFKEPNYLFAILERYNKYNSVLDLSKHSTEEIEFDSKNPYNPEETLREKNFVDKRRALDDFFYQQRGGNLQSKDNRTTSNINGIVTNSILRGSTLGNLDPRLVNDFAKPLFDIKIGYGTVLNADTIGEQIVGVKLIGKGKTIMANGEPLKESYSFFAKNLV